MLLGHLTTGVGSGLLAMLILAIGGQPLWRMALAYALVGSLTVVTCVILELWRTRPTPRRRPGWPRSLPLTRATMAGPGVKA